MDNYILDIEEFERKLQEDAPFKDSEGNIQRFPSNEGEKFEFESWYRLHELHFPKIPDKYRLENWKYIELKNEKENKEEEEQENRFIESFKNAVIAIGSVFIILLLLFIYKIISLFFLFAKFLILI